METITRNGFTAYIKQDESPESPRDWDNLGTMVCWHRNYNLGDVNGQKEYDSPAEFLKTLPKGSVILPLWLYDHSGISISTGSFVGRAQHADWDSGQVGFIYATPETIHTEYSCKRISAKTRAKVAEVLKAEVKTYDQYLRGDVYWYQIEDEDGEVVDSCCGFFGYEYAEQEANSALDAEITSRRAEDKAAESYMAL